MQTSLDQPPPKSTTIKNIIIRHSCSKKVKFSSYREYPEISHILKYSPKYYHNLTIKITPSHPLLSKIKQIKKLKRFTGLFCEALPHKLWFNLLANSRKEIEEIPRIMPLEHDSNKTKSFWQKLNLHKVKFLPNLRRVAIPTWNLHYLSDEADSFLSIKEVFVNPFIVN